MVINTSTKKLLPGGASWHWLTIHQPPPPTPQKESSPGAAPAQGFLESWASCTLARTSQSTGQQPDREDRQNPATGEADRWPEARVLDPVSFRTLPQA